MAFYENRVEHFGGALVLFQRNLEVAVPKAEKHRRRAWYMRLKINGKKGYITRSTKLAVYEEAYEFAKGELLRLQQAARLGHSLVDFTFEQHWDDWFSRNVKNKAWREDRERWHKNYAARYFKPYFKDKSGESLRLNDITNDVALSYWDWRISYWDRPEAEKIIKSNPRRKGAKTVVTNNAKARPALKTLQMEQSALNQIFRDAVERGRMQQAFKMKVPQQSKSDSRRAYFQPNEYVTLVRNLRSYRDCVGVFKDDKPNAWHLLQRQQMYYFIQFLANSGLRVGEAREMKWSDVTFDQEVEGSDEVIATIRVSKHTKNAKERFVQTQPSANRHLQEWYSITPHKRKSDVVWFGQAKGEDDKAQPFNDLNKGFQQLLKRIAYEDRPNGLLYCADGGKRSLYSLRHTYATLRILRGNVGVYDLALNMGCKVVQIERHYSHVLAEMRRHEITKTKPVGSKNEKAKKDDAVPLEVRLLTLFEEGKLSEDGLIKLLAQKSASSS